MPGKIDISTTAICLLAILATGSDIAFGRIFNWLTLQVWRGRDRLRGLCARVLRRGFVTSRVLCGSCALRLDVLAQGCWAAET